MKELLFNPFRRIAGAAALGAGLLFMAMAAFIASYSRCHFDGVLDVHLGLSNPLWSYFIEGLVAWLITVVIFYIVALIFAGFRTRFIDIAGTMALARWPMIFAALFCFIISPATDPAKPSAAVLIMALGLLASSIWMIVLMYQAYVVSTHLKGQKAIWSFVTALVISELLSKLFWWQLASVFTLNF